MVERFVRIVTNRIDTVKEDHKVAKLALEGANDPWYSSLVSSLESGLLDRRQLHIPCKNAGLLLISSLWS